MRGRVARAVVVGALAASGCSHKPPPAKPTPAAQESQPGTVDSPAFAPNYLSGSMDTLVATEMSRNCFGDPKAFLPKPTTTATAESD